MGNFVQCGDVCKSTRQNKWDIPPPKDSNSQHQFIEDDQSGQSTTMFGIRNPNQSIRKTRLGELLDEERPAVETKVEQNHLIVPISLVRARVDKKLSHALGEEMKLSSFRDSSTWYLLPSGNYYSGELKDNEPIGVGTFLLPKMIYFGSVRNQKPEGEGSILGEEFQFKGKFERGRATGQGELIFNSCYLKGQFNNGKIQRGKLTCLEFQYEGQFLNGQPDGMGQYHDNNHTQCFIGQFVKGKSYGETMRKCLKSRPIQQDINDKKTSNKSREKLKSSKKTLMC